MLSMVGMREQVNKMVRCVIPGKCTQWLIDGTVPEATQAHYRDKRISGWPLRLISAVSSTVSGNPSLASRQARLPLFSRLQGQVLPPASSVSLVRALEILQCFLKHNFWLSRDSCCTMFNTEKSDCYTRFSVIYTWLIQDQLGFGGRGKLNYKLEAVKRWLKVGGCDL